MIIERIPLINDRNFKNNLKECGNCLDSSSSTEIDRID